VVVVVFAFGWVVKETMEQDLLASPILHLLSTNSESRERKSMSMHQIGFNLPM
jgi:hypothetical protein